MNKLKTSLILLLLLCLTAITVLLPIILNTDSSARISEDSIPYTRKNSEITSKQVAKLCSSGEISSSLVLCLMLSACDIKTPKSENAVYPRKRSEETQSQVFDSLAEYESENVKEILISVPALCQYPELPTGCESTAAAMVLKFYGTEISPAEFAESSKTVRKAWVTCCFDLQNRRLLTFKLG